MAQPFHPAYVCVGGIIIDDIVFPDGRTAMGVLGGGVTHAAAGMVIWGQRPGLVSCAGRDLPEDAHRRLLRDFDLDGMQWLDIPQARAWQLFESDGRRSEIFRVDEMGPFLYGPPLDALPVSYHDARGVHLLGSGTDDPKGRIDYAVGVSEIKKVGTQVKQGEPLMMIHYNDEAKLEQALEYFKNAYRLAPKRPTPPPLVVERVA